MQKSNTPRAVHDCHQLTLWFIPLLHKWPKPYRFGLAARIEDHLLTLLEQLIQASYNRDKADLLKQANYRLEMVRHLWRMAFELRLIPSNRYEHGGELIVTLGRQVGGWLKQQRISTQGQPSHGKANHRLVPNR